MILGVLQARTSSTRLPGKVLMPLAGIPMMLRQIERLRRARRLDVEIITSSDIRGFVAARPDLARFGGHRRI